MADPARPLTEDEALKLRFHLRVALALGLIAVLAIGSCPRRESRSDALPDSNYKAAAQSLVRQRLRDPSSAEFSEVRVVTATRAALTVCGRVNARNGFGGMTGPKRFVVGRSIVLEEEVGSATMDEIWAISCR